MLKLNVFFLLFLFYLVDIDFHIFLLFYNLILMYYNNIKVEHLENYFKHVFIRGNHFIKNC